MVPDETAVANGFIFFIQEIYYQFYLLQGE